MKVEIRNWIMKRKYEMKRLQIKLLNNSYRENESLNVNQSQNLYQNNSDVYNRNEQQEEKEISEIIECYINKCCRIKKIMI